MRYIKRSSLLKVSSALINQPPLMASLEDVLPSYEHKNQDLVSDGLKNIASQSLEIALEILPLRVQI